MQTYGTIGIGAERRRRYVWLLALALSFMALTALARATTLLSESFIADGSLPIGSIVSLKEGSTDHVTAAINGNNNDILGVVVSGDSSQLAISSNQSNEVHVATSGIEQVLVSDINGSINQGDSITSSPIQGVGMKATTNSKVVGVAQANFPNNTAQTASYKDQKGQKQSVKAGDVPVLVNVAYYYKQPDKTLIPPALQNLANSLAGKQVNALPILIATGIFVVAMFVVISIVYSMIHSSIISVGRNPMAQSAVYRNVLQLSALVVVILAVAIGSIFMVLTKF